MNYIIFDLEYNQPGKIGNIYVRKNEECPSEIIEIGAVKLNSKLDIVDNFRIYIRPTVSKYINPRVLRKTKITKKDLEYGFIFPTAFKHFKSWCGDNFILCSWSNNDIVEMFRNCWYHNLKFDISDSYLDIQKLDMKVNNLNNIRSLGKAIEVHNIIFEKKLHRALHDSTYTALVFKKNFDNNVTKQLLINPNDIEFKYQKYMTDLSDYSIDKDKLITKCPECQELIVMSTEWEVGEDKRFWALGECCNCNNFISTHVAVLKDSENQIKYQHDNSVLDKQEYNRLKRKFFN